MLATLTHLATLPALLPTWLSPEHILNSLGDWALWGGAAIIFAECGLLIGFFLPGDSLLFTVGMLITSDVISQPLWLACLVLTVAAIAGNIVGYQIGRTAGPAIFNKPDSRLFKHEYAEKTTAFFDKYGARAIILARFVPIVRTFITVMAGVGKMDRRRYFLYSGIGGVLWATGVTLLGAGLGRFSFVHNNLEPMIILIVALSVIPMVVEYKRERRRTRLAAAESGSNQ
jgi:membrane-associated protein